VLPLDTEVGGPSPLIRDMVKTGVFGGGQVEFIPRPDIIGTILTGVIGKDVSTAVPSATGAFKHVIDFKTDPFDVDYYTSVHAPGGLWGDQLADCRLTALGLNWRAANFVRGTLGVSGGLPSKVTTPTGAIPDSGVPFLTVMAGIELPTATALKVLAGSFVAGNSIPMDEQWVVGSYSPDAFDIVSRAFAIQLVVKITDATLYSKMMYDPAGGSAWAASLFREAHFKLQFNADKMVGTGTPVPTSLIIKGHSTVDNVVWSADPIAVRAGRQIIMSMTGMFLATDAGSPITVELTNATALAY